MELVNESLSEITESKTDDDTSVNLDEEGIINMLQTAPRIDYLEVSEINFILCIKYESCPLCDISRTKAETKTVSVVYKS